MAKSVNFFTDIFYIFFGFFLTIFSRDYTTTNAFGQFNQNACFCRHRILQ